MGNRENPNPARVLIVAGSDSGGGAGIQADIKTAAALGAYAMTAITAVTVQNTLGVQSFHKVPPDMVGGQMRSVLSDIGADAVKTGMLVSADIVNEVAEILSSPVYGGGARGTRAEGAIPLVVDTVMIAKGGTALLDDEGVEAMRRRLFPLAALVTPNAPEAARLTGMVVKTAEDLIAAAKKLHAEGARAVLAKGGHVPGGTITDVLVDSNGVRLFRARRIETTSTHGTGCTLATAIATGLAQGLPLEESITRARTYLHEALRTGLALGGGNGPLNHLHGICE